MPKIVTVSLICYRHKPMYLNITYVYSQNHMECANTSWDGNTNHLPLGNIKIKLHVYLTTVV
jgi:hypothetical protein